MAKGIKGLNGTRSTPPRASKPVAIKGIGDGKIPTANGPKPVPRIKGVK